MELESGQHKLLIEISEMEKRNADLSNQLLNMEQQQQILQVSGVS